MHQHGEIKQSPKLMDICHIILLCKAMEGQLLVRICSVYRAISICLVSATNGMILHIFTYGGQCVSVCVQGEREGQVSTVGREERSKRLPALSEQLRALLQTHKGVYRLCSTQWRGRTLVPVPSYTGAPTHTDTHAHKHRHTHTHTLTRWALYLKIHV